MMQARSRWLLTVCSERSRLATGGAFLLSPSLLRAWRTLHLRFCVNGVTLVR